jgi:uncharacterized protein (TIGR00297 family)
MDSPAAISNALIVGVPLSTAVAVWAFKIRLLTRAGGLAAVGVGVGAVYGGWVIASALLFFFFSAALWARLLGRNHNKTTLVQEQGEPRSAFQVLATGGLPALCGIIFGLTGNPEWQWMALAALAFAIADTWATEWGQSSISPPRLLGWGTEVPAGLSGGVTLRGTAGSVAGALCVGVIGSVGSGASAMVVILLLTSIGITGSLTDSVLGATLQQRLKCPVCHSLTERPRHCATDAVRIRGFLSNTGVNLICSAVALALGWVVYPA